MRHSDSPNMELEVRVRFTLGVLEELPEKAILTRAPNDEWIFTRAPGGEKDSRWRE